MFSRLFSRMIDRRCGSRGSTSPHGQRRRSHHLAAATGQAMEALESRVLLSTLYVDASAPGPTYNGSSWTTAYKDLQLALSASTSGDEIRIADGTYKPTSTTDRTISFALRDGVAIYGGYAGYGASDPDARDIVLYPTILSANIGTAGSNADNSYHVLIASGVGPSTVLDGITVTGGNANGSGWNQRYGGGLFASNSSPMLSNCTFTQNSASSGGGMYNASPSSPMLSSCIFSSNSADYGAGMYNSSASSPALINSTFKSNSAKYTGGGMYNNSSSPTVTNCTFSGNFAGASGGGMHNSSSSPTLTNCSFSANSVSSVSWITSGGAMSNSSSSPTLVNCTFSGNSASGLAGYGGGMYNSSSSPVLTNCTFSGNSAGRYGGGMYNYSSSAPTLANCTFSGNSISGTAGSGGGLYNDSSSPTLTDCILRGNSASSGGGMYSTSSSSPNLTNCTFSGNSGGGMSNSSSSPTLTNCTFSGNSASGNGGGMSNSYSSSPVLTNCTFSGNSAGSYGGGMSNSYSSSPVLTNCTIGGNSASSGGGMYNSSSSPTLTNCLVWGNVNGAIQGIASAPAITYTDIQGGYSGAGNTDADPLFVRFPWTGPDGVFGTADDDPGDLRLREGSPVLDIGSNAAVSGLSTDLDGNPRIQNGTVDMGAHEGVVAAPAPRILYVDATARGAYTGISWADALTSLASALTRAADGDIIRVADGSYKPTSTSNRTISFALRNGVAIYGGYAGHGASDPNARDIALYPTILSGNIGAAASSTDNSYHVLTASGVGASTILDGVTVAEGNADGVALSQSYGGGLYAISTSLTLTNCTFSGNSASGTFGSGGAVYNSSSSPMLTNCTFSGNVASGAHGSAGGMYNSSSSPTLTNCSFRGNSASSSGGGMYNDSSSPSLVNCTFSGNAASSGGGMYNTSSSPTLVNCTISGNAASTQGGAISNLSSSPTLTNCIVWANTASSSPQMYQSGGASMVTCSDIQGGYAGIGNINAAPLFVRSPWTGPDGVFGTADDDPGDLRLREGSPVLNIGSNAAVFGLSADLAGNGRIQNGTVDMGAYEGPIAAPIPKSLYVDDVASGTNTGGSWADAFTSLQSALAAAGAGDTIRVAHGIYRPTSSTDRAISFALRDGVAILGGYAGYGAYDPDARDIALYPTILSASIGAAAKTDNSYHVLTASGVGAATILDGVTVTAGNANGAGPYQGCGGGLLAISASPTLTNCSFNGNSAGTGGGMYNYSSSPTLTNCIFSGNSASNGGGICNTSSSPTLVNCTISGNSAGTGGGMYNSSSSPTLVNCIVWGNASQAINDGASTPVITCSDVQGGYTGVGNVDADPLFVRSPWTGPDGVFGTADDDFGDLRLREGSPALDIGSNAAVSGVSTDLAGNARTQSGTVDLGAYEGHAVAPTSKTLYVDTTATGTNTGVSWVDAFTSLQSALLAAGDGDTIRIADGTYRPTSTTDRTISFALRNGVAIHGGYAGYGAPDPDAHHITLYRTILSGDIGAIGSRADNSYRVLTASGVGTSTVLDGVTITGGNANGPYSTKTGGGLYATGGSPLLINCTISGNSADGSGGGMYNDSSSPTLINCTISGNLAGSAAAGICNWSSSPMLVNCTISGNAASTQGGAISNLFSSPTLVNCIVWGNTASSSPQMYQSGGASSVTYSNIQGGYAGIGNISADPLFVRSPSRGPDNTWGTADDDYGDLRLQPASPCIDRGNNAATGLAGATIDLAGKPRFVDIALMPDAGAGTPVVDMGAYEAQWACPPWLDPAGVAVWNAGDYSLDIGSGVLTVAADDTNRSERLAAIWQAIALGRGTGAGIIRSAAGEDRGVIAAVDGEGNILVRVALLGDVTLDERIDGDDYFAMDLAFLAGTGGMQPEADVNVDGVIDGRDYLMLDLGFLRNATGGVQTAGVSVEQAAQQPPAGVFSTRSIADELLMEESSVL